MDEHEEKERFRRAFSPLRASGGVLTEVFEMTTRKERRAPRAGKRLLVIALTAALALALAAAAYAADLFGIRALLVPGEGRVSLTQFQAIPEDLPPETYAKAENFLDAWAEWKDVYKRQVLGYAAMLLAVLAFFSGHGAFIYEGF